MDRRVFLASSALGLLGARGFSRGRRELMDSAGGSSGRPGLVIAEIDPIRRLWFEADDAGHARCRHSEYGAGHDIVSLDAPLAIGSLAGVRVEGPVPHTLTLLGSVPVTIFMSFDQLARLTVWREWSGILLIETAPSTHISRPDPDVVEF